MANEQDKKIALLETLVNNQKHVIELLSMLNNNVEELILDIKDIKNNQKYESSNNLSLPTSSCSTSDVYENGKNSMCQNNLRNNGMILNDCEHSIQNQMDSIHSQNRQQSQLDTIDKFENVEIDNTSISNSRQHNFINSSNNNRMKNLIPNNNDEFKSVKTGLREFSTFVSKMVRQEFGSNFLALTRINELDRYVMQKIRDEAISKYLPNGISHQFAWNHAMNSLRQLRHRQCKKAKITLNQVL